MNEAELVTIEMTIHHETDRAILASDDGNKSHAVWLPRSQIEIDDEDRPLTVLVTMPEWLAIEKGLV